MDSVAKELEEAEIRIEILKRQLANAGGNENNLAVLLVAMNVVFLVCNSGKAVVNVWEISHISDKKECMAISMPYKVSIYDTIMLSSA